MKPSAAASWEPSVGPSESGGRPGSSNSPSDEHRSQSSYACHKTGNRKRRLSFWKGTDLICMWRDSISETLREYFKESSRHKSVIFPTLHYDSLESKKIKDFQSARWNVMF